MDIAQACYFDGQIGIKIDVIGEELDHLADVSTQGCRVVWRTLEQIGDLVMYTSRKSIPNR